ncbi:MAG TPA: GTP-binding protein [Caulobacteraceae bacterium]|jgi:G3E family GTPase|nr:GTP-binding protein [Caulobacteraceae bacterium]
MTEPVPPAPPRPDVRTPVTVLTGFLGSGKTTLLNRALRDPAMARTAVVINEFGEVGLDHALATASDDTILVLENGCLCCTVFGDLIGAMNDLYHAREAGKIPAFDHVVIETSGLADPGPVLQAFLSEPTLEGLYRIGAVVATVDAINGPGTLDEHAESVRQVALADHILITKLDLAPEGAAAALTETLKARLRALNPAADIVLAGEAGAAPVHLLRDSGFDPSKGGDTARAWLNAEAYADHHHDHEHGHDHDDHHHHHHHNIAIASFCLVRDEPTSREALQLLLAAIEKNLGPNLLRVKGLVAVAEEPGKPAVLQGAQHLLHNLTWLDAWPDADHRTRIVFITQNMPKADLEEMVSLLDRVATRTAAARRRAQAARDGT